jgi:nitroreductase
VNAVTWQVPADVASALEAATRAPSMHNSQPWQFRVRLDEIDILVDPQRQLAVADATGWASRIAGGCALFNLRLALAVCAMPAAYRLLPDPADPLLLARLTAQPRRAPTPAEHRMYAVIPRRHSNRTPFAERPVPVQVRAELVAAARAEGGWLDLLLGPEAIETAAELVHSADNVLRRDAQYQGELASWTRDSAAATDGIPASAGGPAPQPDEMLRRRDLGGPDRAGHLDFEREPLLAVLGSSGDRPGDQIQAGQVLERVLLTATDLGLSASMFSQPIEVPAAREQLRELLGRHAPPQMVLRLGYAVAASGSPRRPVSEVLVN